MHFMHFLSRTMPVVIGKLQSSPDTLGSLTVVTRIVNINTVASIFLLGWKGGVLRESNKFGKEKKNSSLAIVLLCTHIIPTYSLKIYIIDIY